MKIVVATPLYPPELGAPAAYVKELAERLSLQHQVVVVAYATTSEPCPGAKLVTVSKRYPLPLRLLAHLIQLLAAARKADVIYAQKAVASGLPAIFAGRLLGVPVVINFIGDEAWERAVQLDGYAHPPEVFWKEPALPRRTRALVALQRFVLRRASLVVVESAYMAATLAEAYGLPRQRCVVCYPPPERPEQLPIVAKPAAGQVVVDSRLVPWKNVAEVLRSFPLVLQSHPEARLAIIGDGPEEQKLRNLAASLNLLNQVSFLGRTAKAESWFVRAQSAVYVLGSTSELSVQPALAGVATGTATVATATPATAEALTDGQTALLVAAGDWQALVGAVVQLLGDAAQRHRLAANAAAAYARKFSWEAHLGSLTAALSQVASKQP